MEILKKIGKCLAILVILNIVYMIFMTVAYTTPVDGKVKENVGNSLFTVVNEDQFPVFHDPNGYWNDITTDLIWLNMAVCEGKNPFEGAMALYYQMTSNIPEDGNPQTYHHLVSALYYNGAEGTHMQQYSRYWLLFMGILKPMFLIWEISEIRYIFYFVLFALSTTLIYQMGKVLDWRGIVPLGAAMAVRLWQMHSICLATMPDILIAIISMLLVINMYKKDTFKDKHMYLFLIIGSFSFAFGPLIAPILTLGMPLVLSIMLGNEKSNKIESWIRIIVDSVAWVAGYAISLIFKQMLAKAVIGMQDGTEEALYWFGMDMGFKERIDRIIYCFDGLLSPLNVKLPILLVIIAILIIAIIKNGINKTGNMLLLLFLALYPIAWIFVVVRHSQHYWAANILSVTVFAILAMLTMSVNKKSDREKDTVSNR